jgi:pimeloyl-ACP methyl ester carboxylesterase/DNA-binding CsgD family transcriptional regulator
MAPRIKYAKTSDGINIAYSASGQGPPLVYLPWTLVSHVEREWQYPEYRSWLERLDANHRLIRLDHRGTGLSDRGVEFSLELATLDLEAVVRAEGLRRFGLTGQMHSAATAILYASEHQEMVSHLILWCPFLSMREFVVSSPQLRATMAAATKDLDTFTEFLAQQATGWADASQARRFAAYLRECIGGAELLDAISHIRNFDVSSKLEKLATPVLVIHRREAPFPTTDAAKRLAADTPDARLVILEGAALVPFLGDTDAILAAVDQFEEEVREQARPGGLTKRQVQILCLVAGGNSNEAIARTLTLSTRTVERHIANVYRKIGAHNRAEATAYAFHHKIVPA